MILRTSYQIVLQAFFLFSHTFLADAVHPHHLRHVHNQRRQAPSGAEPLEVGAAPVPSSASSEPSIFSGTQILQDLADLASSDIPVEVASAIANIISQLEELEGALLPLLLSPLNTVPPVSATMSSAVSTQFTPTPPPYNPYIYSPSSSAETIFTTVYSTNMITVTANGQTPPSPTQLVTLPYNGTASPTATTTVVSTSVISVFDPYATDNVAVYFGSTPDPKAPSSNLDTLCQDPDINIINIAFVTSFFGPGGFPTIDFGTMCSGQTFDMTALGTDLESCNALGNKLQACQAMGKKIFVSVNIGGTPWNGNISTIPITSFPTRGQATQFANMLWDLFGNGSAPQNDSDLRPLGVQPFGPEVVVDGFDIYFATTNSSSVITNNSSNYSSPASTKKRQSQTTVFPYFSDFFATLRNNFASDTSKDYYLSASLPCALPPPLDEVSIQLLDYVSVRFYGDPSCDISQPYFAISLQTWINNVLFDVTSPPPAPSSGTGVSIAATSTSGAVETELALPNANTTIYEFSESTSTEYVVPVNNTTPPSFPVPTAFAPNPTNGTNFTGPYPLPNGSYSMHPTGIRFGNTMIPYTGPYTPLTTSASNAANSSTAASPSPSSTSTIAPNLQVLAEEESLQLFHVALTPSQLSPRGMTQHPLLLLGLLAPPNPFASGNSSVNSTAVTQGTAGAIPLSQLTSKLRGATGMAGFGGVMLWGGVSALEPSGDMAGFVTEVKEILDGVVAFGGIGSGGGVASSPLS